MPINPTSGAHLQPISLTAPAFKGLNKQNETAILGAEWATIFSNGVFDTAGRVSSRKGWIPQTTTVITGGPTIRQLHEYVKKDGTTYIIAAAANKLYAGGVPTFTDVHGALVYSGDNWQFCNYNGYCLGWQQGIAPVQYNGSGAGSFTAITATSGTVPTGNCVAVGSGRVWASDADGQTIKYSALLDHTKWAIADGAGSIDMSSVWPNGMDTIQAITFFNNLFVVFGKRTIVLWTDGAGSALGIDPSHIIVADAITGTGCIARDTVREVEGPDLLFLSDQGVQSLQRVIQEKSNPIANVSANIRDYMMAAVRSSTLTNVRAVYSPEESMYLLSCPEAMKAFYFNTKGKLDDGTFRASEWTLYPTAMVRTNAGLFYLANNINDGRMHLYSGYYDNASASYTLDYASGWLDLGEELAQYLKIMKSLSAVVYVASSASLDLKWAFDFNDTFSSAPVSVIAGGSAEYNVAEYGLAEYSGGLSLRNVAVSTSGTGQYIRVGLASSIGGFQLSIQQLKPTPKIGRLVK